MRAFLTAAFAALVVWAGGAGDANADWRDSILGASAFREPLPGAAAPRTRSAARSTSQSTASAKAASRRQATTQVASASSSEEAPQRKGRRSQPTSTSSATGGGEWGVASYYWQPQRVASGGWFNPNAYTAAHKSLPFGTRVRVTRTDNGNSVEVTINDRGPYVAGRIIDLSKRAAESIGMTGQGLARVRVQVLGRG
jgi:rare lipoprotein A